MVAANGHADLEKQVEPLLAFDPRRFGY